MLKQPLVSIIIPTYNRAHLIGETLDSVLAQTYTNWECIVVDDGSKDDTEELLSSYVSKDGRFQYHKRPDSHLPGGNGARNYGFEISKGFFIQWFDSDDIMLPDFLNQKLSFFNNAVQMVLCSGSYVKDDLAFSKIINLTLQSYLFKDYVLWRLPILTPSVLFRKSFLEGKTLFSNKIFRGQETEFFSRLFFKLPTSNYVIINTSLFLYRQHEKTKTKLNVSYVSKFKYSQSVIFLNNLKRSIELDDYDLINHCFQTLLIYFHTGLKNKDYQTCHFIYTKLVPILKNNYSNVFVEFKAIGGLLLFFKISSYRIYKRWKNIRLC